MFRKQSSYQGLTVDENMIYALKHRYSHAQNLRKEIECLISGLGLGQKFICTDLVLGGCDWDQPHNGWVFCVVSTDGDYQVQLRELTVAEICIRGITGSIVLHVIDSDEDEMVYVCEFAWVGEGREHFENVLEDEMRGFVFEAKRFSKRNQWPWHREAEVRRLKRLQRPWWKFW